MGVAVSVRVAVLVGGGVRVGVFVAVGVRVALAVLVGVWVNVGTRVGDDVKVAVAVWVGEAVGVSVAVAVRVGDAVAVGVAVAVDGIGTATTNGDRLGVRPQMIVSMASTVVVMSTYEPASRWYSRMSDGSGNGTW